MIPALKPAPRWSRPLGTMAQGSPLAPPARLPRTLRAADSSQHYSAPRVSPGSGPWHQPLGLAASAPSEPCGPRARAARQAPLRSLWVHPGSWGPALAPVFSAGEAKALLKDLFAPGLPRAPSSPAGNACAPRGCAQGAPQPHGAWRRQGSALTARRVPLRARAGWEQWLQGGGAQSRQKSRCRGFG